ncbi:MAG: hypothetical protein ABR991_08455 [Terracidiphilus sp.]|jgi:hypothetical protein
MLKRLAIIAIAAIVAVSVSGQPNQIANQKQEPAKQSQPTVLPAGSQNKQTSKQTDQPKPDTNPPKWYAALDRPDWWVVGLAFFTACVICWQSWETRKSASAAFAQIQMTKAKERARLEIKGSGMGCLKGRHDSWWIKGFFEFRNTGNSKAYIIKTGGGITIADSFIWPLPKTEGSEFDWPDSVIDPSKSGLISSVRVLSGTRDKFAIAVSSGKSIVYVKAFIEYESMGTIWHRDIGYVWIPTDSKTNASFVTVDLQTGEQRITDGRWATSPNLKNGEYEVHDSQKTD